MRGKAMAAALAAVVIMALAPATQPGADLFRNESSGDTTIAGAVAIPLYACFSRGGGILHSGIDFTGANGCSRAKTGWLRTVSGAVRVRVFGSARVDTAGKVIEAGETIVGFPACDSILVLNISGVSTRITWALYR